VYGFNAAWPSRAAAVRAGISLVQQYRRKEGRVYLSQLDVEGFRSLSRVSIALGRDVSVLVGENSGGKSNVIDALRLLTDPIDGRRTLYLDREDVFRGPGTVLVTLRATYTGSAEDLAAYQHAASPELDRLLYALRYTPPGTGQIRGQVDWVAGNGADPCDPQPRGRDRLRHVYLPPLRDAARDLGSQAGPRIQAILDCLLTGPEPVRDADGNAIDQAGMLDFVRSRFAEVEDHPVITAATSRISTRLSRLTSGAYEQAAGLGFAATSVQALARGLRVRLADAGLVPREIAESGMGYANLLFIATVLAQLDAAREADLTLLLVEEPEAHLHPPLQALLLDYLRDAAAASRSTPQTGRWRGYLQVVITSHAPSLAASADVADLIVLGRRATAQPASAGPAATAAPPTSAVSQAPAAAGGTSGAAPSSDTDVAMYETAAINVAALGLSQADRSKLNRYLNATRSAMLFSPRVMLVEGIAEALVLPPMASTLFPAGSIERARFVGTVLVPIDGVDFAPYLRVLLTTSDGRRIGQRIAVITDSDTQNPRHSGAERIAALTRMIADLGASEHAAVFAGPTTLEPELLIAGNDDAVWKAWAAQQPRAWQTVKAAVDAADLTGRATAFAIKLKDADLRKGDFALDFLYAVETTGTSLRIPSYLENALRWLTASPTPPPGS
jgi:putative ATP-dependent endonuclease of the OLD family